MIVREVEEADLDGLLELYTHLHDNAMPVRDEKLLALWSEILVDKNHHIVVAEDRGEIVSSCVIVTISNLTHGQRPYALIENVVTSAGRRREGVASACLEKAKEIAVQANCYKIMLMTGSKQESTLSFYERAGYNRKDKTAFIMWLT